MEYSFIESKLVATQTRNDTINKYGSIQEIRCQPTTTFYIRECMCHDDIYIYIYIYYVPDLTRYMFTPSTTTRSTSTDVQPSSTVFPTNLCCWFCCCCWRQHSIVVMVLKNQVMDSFQKSITLTLPLYFIMCSIGSTNDNNQNNDKRYTVYHDVQVYTGI